MSGIKPFKANIDDIIKLSEMLKTDLYGIRNKKTNKFTVMGLMENQLLITDALNWIQTKLWIDSKDVETVYNILCNNNTDFKESYFIDKLTNDEYEEYCKENRI